jgi:hypothetical protein
MSYILNNIDFIFMILNISICLIWSLNYRSEYQSLNKTFLITLILLLSGVGVLLGIIILYYCRIYDITIFGYKFSEDVSVKFFLE